MGQHQVCFAWGIYAPRQWRYSSQKGLVTSFASARSDATDGTNYRTIGQGEIVCRVHQHPVEQSLGLDGAPR
eukprot:4460001-Amphidinium_carterae.2